MATADREALFDEWAQIYGIDAAQASHFPFLGYHQVLDEVVCRATRTDPAAIVDLGAGTGTLTSLLRGLVPDARIVAVDFSQQMLARLEALDIGIETVRADLSEGPLPDLPRAETITGTYVLHELTDSRKVELLADLAAHVLASDGRIVIGDVGFPNVTARAKARDRFAADWDPHEHYFAVRELSDRFAAVGLELRDATYPSDCACVLEIGRVLP